MEAVRPADRGFAREPAALLAALVCEVLRPHRDRRTASQAAEKVDALIGGDDFLLQLANELSLDTPPERKRSTSLSKKKDKDEAEPAPPSALSVDDVSAGLVDLARKPDDFVSQLTSLLAPVDLPTPNPNPPPVPSRPQKQPSFSVGQAVVVSGQSRPGVVRQIDAAAGTYLVALEDRQDWLKASSLAPAPFTPQEDSEVAPLTKC